jgi:hypothetical protein
LPASGALVRGENAPESQPAEDQVFLSVHGGKIRLRSIVEPA